MAKYKIDAEHSAFLRDLKNTKKAHPTLLREDLPACLREIEQEPEIWPRIPGLETEVRKARVGVKKQSIGKSGGYRLIYLVERGPAVIRLLALHYKPDLDLLPLEEIVRRIASQHRRASGAE